MQKICNSCKVERSIDNFVNSQNGKETKLCAQCRSYARKSILKIHGKNYHDSRRNSNFKAMYGITLDEYDRMFAAQEGKCLICSNTHSTVDSKKLAVDHDHNTNKVRGLLCSACNQGLGYFKDDPELMQKALDYLKSHKEDM